jgi:hypothetical protein
MPAPGTGAAGGALTGLDVRRRSGAKPSHSHDAQASEGGTHVDEARLLPRSTDTQTRQTWTEFSHKSPKDQAIEVASLQNKAAAVADPLPLRLVLAQSNSTIDFRKLIETGTNLCLDLSDLGDEPAHLLGALVLNAFRQTAETFTAPKPYTLVIDEFQNFGTHAVSTILSESGKRGLSLTLAHQFLSQLDEEVRDAVLGNCSTIVSFRVGAEDAAIIGRAIDVAPQALMDLGRGKAYRRTLLNDAPSEAQYLETREAELPASSPLHCGGYPMRTVLMNAY